MERELRVAPNSNSPEDSSRKAQRLRVEIEPSLANQKRVCGAIGDVSYGQSRRIGEVGQYLLIANVIALGVTIVCPGGIRVESRRSNRTNRWHDRFI